MDGWIRWRALTYLHPHLYPQTACCQDSKACLWSESILTTLPLLNIGQVILQTSCEMESTLLGRFWKIFLLLWGWLVVGEVNINIVETGGERHCRGQQSHWNVELTGVTDGHLSHCHNQIGQKRKFPFSGNYANCCIAIPRQLVDTNKTFGRLYNFSLLQRITSGDILVFSHSVTTENEYNNHAILSFCWVVIECQVIHLNYWVLIVH